MFTLTPRRSTTLLTTLGAAAVLLAAPAIAAQGASGATAEPTLYAAPSGTLVYIRGHNVWVARADGSEAHAVTTDGTASQPYHSPTMSDAGVIATGRGQSIVRMTQHGQVLNTIDPQPLTTSTSHAVDGVPVDVAISPDGARIAYSFRTYECPVGASCGERYVTGYTASDRFTSSAPHGISYLNSPSWVTNGRTVEGGGFGSQVNVHDIGRNPSHWFDDSAYSTEWQDWEDLSEPDVSPDGRRLAVVRSYGDREHIAFFEVLGDARTDPAPKAPYRHCVTGQQPGFADPTWSADSTTLGWEEPTGIWMVVDPVPNCAAQPRLVIPGGSEPDFSAATLMPAPVTPPVPTVPSTPTTGPAPGAPPVTPAPSQATTPRNLVRPTLQGRPRAGSVLSVTAGTWTPRPDAYRYRWTREGKTIRGAITSRYRLTSRDAGRSVRVFVTALRGGTRATASSKAVVVRR